MSVKELIVGVGVISIITAVATWVIAPYVPQTTVPRYIYHSPDTTTYYSPDTTTYYSPDTIEQHDGSYDTRHKKDQGSYYDTSTSIKTEK